MIIYFYKINNKVCIMTSFSNITTYILGDICDFMKGEKIKIPQQTNELNIPIINDTEEIRFYTDKYNRKENTIIINFLRKCGCIQKYNKKIFLNNHFYSIHSKDHGILNEEYLYYYLKNIQDKIYTISEGNLLKFVSLYDIQKLHIHIPSLEEQKKIIKDIENNNNEIEKLLESIKNIRKENKKLFPNIIS